jgi:hypothetical protein
MEVVAMTQFFSKISNKLKIGYGSCHVTGVNGIRYISRWGIWSTPLTILFSKIHPVSSTVEAIPDTKENASVIYHSHPFSFLSVILKGTYTEEINDNGNIIFKKRKWFNFVSRDTFHKINCDEDVWTIQAGFVKTNKVRIKIDNKTYAHKRIFTTGGIDD